MNSLNWLFRKKEEHSFKMLDEITSHNYNPDVQKRWNAARRKLKDSDIKGPAIMTSSTTEEDARRKYPFKEEDMLDWSKIDLVKPDTESADIQFAKILKAESKRSRKRRPAKKVKTIFVCDGLVLVGYEVWTIKENLLVYGHMTAVPANREYYQFISLKNAEKFAEKLKRE